MAVKTEQAKSHYNRELLREKKIQECRQRISKSQQALEELHLQQERLCDTDIIGMSVKHKLFGAGIITEQNATSVTVSFDSGSRRFVMPSAFIDVFLNTEDSAMNDRLSEYLCMQQKIRETKNEIFASNHTIHVLEAEKKCSFS